MNEQFSSCHSPCQPSCDDLKMAPCPPPACIPGCHCQPGFIRADGSPRSACVPRAACAMYDVSKRCADERRQYHSCGSACPISCDNRNTPRCHESCVSGCFCRIPYVLENGNDPLHSRCILPSQCPLVTLSSRENPSGSVRSSMPVSNKDWLRKTASEIYATPGTATLLPDTKQCSDPLKNYLTVERVVLENMKISFENPFEESSAFSIQDPQSGCVLPMHCPRSPFPTGSCADPRKVWTSCGALGCARSCTNPLGRCEAGLCSPGCVCREPYVLQPMTPVDDIQTYIFTNCSSGTALLWRRHLRPLDPMDPSSRCVLPSECSRKCNDPLKEFVVCGSSCPVGCDNRRPQSCTPCESGCFCKNGLVFQNSSNWRNSICVRPDECADFTREEALPTTTSSTTTTAVVSLASAQFSTANENGSMKSSLNRHCCRSLIVSMGVSPQRCTCADPNAAWSACGSLCPEYCGQSAVPHCSSTCNPGCQCAFGFVRARNDVTAPCVPRTSCPNITITKNGEPRAIIKEIPYTPKNPFSDQQLATANLVPAQKSVTGRFSFTQISANNLRISGVLTGLPRGEHAVLIHQYGDLSDGCSRLGPPFQFKRGLLTPSLGDVVVDNSQSASFVRVVDWPIADVVGRSIAIYRLSTTEYSLHAQNEPPLACGTIGLTAFT
ncbi:hypothetical protein KIN20_003066 [Parelaphostrongylus tenuis]|uniref:Superoxide dismutase n=1 Tax=Parelaphostrongylus tenuis TaxID=148309 RepID=A0AAD5MHS3_PARTN|nr:hypothetical protein KIN20_003066 [Parelaphostrongylus tenuis]